MPKVLLVTGGGRGIGAAVCRQASREGYIVAVNYLRDETAAQAVVTEITNAGGTALAVRGDVADTTQVTQMVNTIEHRYGPVYGLVNNAGITGPLGTFLDTSPQTIDAVFRTNVLGMMHCCRAVLDSYAKNGTNGVIVNVSSIAAATGSPNEYVHYAASKAAVETFTYGLAKEWGPKGVRICCVAPGSALTEIHATAGEPGRPERLAPVIPMKRLAEPEEISEAIMWLLSPAASYVTGATLRCSGGL